MGVVPPTQAQPTPPLISASTLGFVDSNGAHPPQGVFFVNSNPFVADTAYSRILGYAPFDQWAPESTAFSPPANVVIGQSDFISGQPNRDQAKPDATTLNQPVTGTFAGTDMFVADAGNNRIVVFPQQTGGAFGTANRLLGQDDFPYNSINLIEGREFGFISGGSAVIDANSDPPHLYVSDPLNNRILGFKDYRKVNAGTTADLVIGQPDFFTAMVNWPTNNVTQANNQGLCSPGRLGGGCEQQSLSLRTAAMRVYFVFPLHLPKRQQATPPQANLVLGQQSFFGQPIKDLSRSTMASAFGVAFTQRGRPGGFRCRREPCAYSSASPRVVTFSPACRPAMLSAKRTSFQATPPPSIFRAAFPSMPTTSYTWLTAPITGLRFSLTSPSPATTRPCCSLSLG